jgi:ferredoxin-NADP reductase
MALAGVVGVVFGGPYNLGFVANSPELALLGGNLIAFFLGQRGRVELTFKGSRALTPGTREFRFEPRRPVRYAAGQFMELNLPHSGSDGKGRRRVFSITSPPGAPEVTFGVGTAGPLSTAKKTLLALRPGDMISATAVGGDFVLPRDAANRDAVVLYLAQGRDELAACEQLEASGAKVIARLADGSAPPDFMHDAGTSRIDAQRLKELVPDIGAREVYVSGSPASVDSLRAAAHGAGARRVHVDSFAGY